MKPTNRITQGGNFPRPGQKTPPTVILTQPKRFGVDISDFTASVRAAENVDFSRRSRLYDLYNDILMDSHLSAVINKRILSVLSTTVEFRRKGTVDESMNEQIRSPWFRRFVKDVMDAQFWGFSLCQFYKEGGWANYDLISRKNIDPVRRIIMHQQTDITGSSWDEWKDLLFIGDVQDLGLLAKAAPWVIYKRNTTADWANFSEIFGMPIREYIYQTDDDESRRRAVEDSQSGGSMATFIHSKETLMNLVESGNKTGSADLYERFCERCNSELSKLFLGNTLTTEASNKGTQALGTIHLKVEDQIAQSDRRFVLDVLNYDMTDILLSMGINTDGGEFIFTEQKDFDIKAKAEILTQLRNTFDLPVSDDYLYEEFDIEKPKDYRQIIQSRQESAPIQAPAAIVPAATPEEKKKFSNFLSGFFADARHDRALRWQ
jgi:phage gp29-like protein